MKKDEINRIHRQAEANKRLAWSFANASEKVNDETLKRWMQAQAKQWSDDCRRDRAIIIDWINKEAPEDYWD